MYTDCTMLNTHRGHKIYYSMQAINNSPWCLPRDVKQKRIKSAGTAKEMPVSDKACESQCFIEHAVDSFYVPSRKHKQAQTFH